MPEDAILPELDEWLSQLDVMRLAKRLRQLEAEYEQLGREIEEREAKRGTVREAIERAYGAIRLKEHWMPTTTSDDNLELFGESASDGERPARGRESVRALLREMPNVAEWTIESVLRELVKRDWADPDDRHSVGVSLSRMFRRGELYRLRHGVYTTRRELMEGADE